MSGEMFCEMFDRSNVVLALCVGPRVTDNKQKYCCSLRLVDLSLDPNEVVGPLKISNAEGQPSLNI